MHLDPILADLLHKHPIKISCIILLYYFFCISSTVIFFTSGAHVSVSLEVRHYVYYYTPLILIPCIKILIAKLYVSPGSPSFQRTKWFSPLVCIIGACIIIIICTTVLITELIVWDCPIDMSINRPKISNCPTQTIILFILSFIPYIFLMVIELHMFSRMITGLYDEYIGQSPKEKID